MNQKYIKLILQTVLTDAEQKHLVGNACAERLAPFYTANQFLEE
jgi:hypothetical protein